jgi:type II secretory pathway component GspD/PulD (secretin)
MGKKLFSYTLVFLIFCATSWAQTTEPKEGDTTSVTQQQKGAAQDTTPSLEDTAKITVPADTQEVDTTVAKQQEEAVPGDTTVSAEDTIQVAVPAEPLVDATILVPLLDFKNADIRDVFNALAKAYSLNIWLDQSVQGKVTISFNKVRLNEVLNFLIKENGLSYEKAENIIKIYKEEAPPPPLEVEVKDNLLSVDLQSVDLAEFVRTLVKKSGRNIVIETGVTGIVSGTLKDIDFDKGLTALLSSNGFIVKKVEGIYHIDKEIAAPGAPPARRAYAVTYKDNLLSIDVTNARLSDLVNQIASQCQLDIFLYGSVEGQVSAKCNGLSVDDALNYIFKGTDYTFRKEKNVYFVGNKQMEGMPASRLIKLDHLAAEGIIELLPQTLATKATLKIVKEQNGLMVNGPYGAVRDIEEFVKEIDHPPAQVLIEALVIDYTVSDHREFGITADNYGLKDELNLLENYYPFIDVYTTREPAQKQLESFASHLGVTNVGHLPQAFFLMLHALEQEGKANVRSRPQIATLNGHQAKIDVGTTQYFLLKTETTYPGAQQALSTQVTERFETIEAAMSLQVTPWVTASGEVIVEIHPEFNTPKGSFDPKIPPTIDHRILDSQVRLRDGETIVLGGLIQTIENTTISRFPILGRIPLIGRLFQNRTTTKTKADLVIYLTPHIYYGSEGAVDVSKYK